MDTNSGRSSFVKLLFAILGIYASFLTWGLVQEPLTTKKWPQSQEAFRQPCVIALVQSLAAAVVGLLYLTWRRSSYSAVDFLREHYKHLALISITQSSSAPLATVSLQYVDYLTYMLAKSCKLIPLLVVHLLFYKTPISTNKKIVALLVTSGVVLFTLGGRSSNAARETTSSPSFYGFGLLFTSLFLDGLTNATQDRLLKRGTPTKNKKITGAHLMFALNLAIVLWNFLYITLVDPIQLENAKRLISLDPQIAYYLGTYALCGALGQCFIFYTLEQYGSLVLVMVTVTRKMVSMILSIVVFGHSVSLVQWLGIATVFGGILWEANLKKRQAKTKPKHE